MARRDESGEDDELQGSTVARAISSIGHTKSGGHSSRSRGLNQIFQDLDDDESGGDGPYVFVEYPKHVIIDGVTYVANDAAHEASIRAKGR